MSKHPDTHSTEELEKEIAQVTGEAIWNPFRKEWDYPEITSRQTKNLAGLIRQKEIEARVSQLESLYRKSEFIGVGYAIIREEHVTAELERLKKEADPLTEQEDRYDDTIHKGA